MQQSTTSALTFETLTGVPLTVDCTAGQLTSEGGLPWLAEVDAALGLCATLAQQIPDWRRGPVRHSLETLLRQRLFQLACGYADQNDATVLRHDPLLKLVCGRPPASGAALASQPTFSRLENAIARAPCYRLAAALVALYLQARERAGPPARVLLDCDGTADPTHGNQEGSAYHGYYRQHMYHPLLIFDGDTAQVITAVLRPGNVHGSNGIVAVLRRLVDALRARWPRVQLELRADAGFAVPALYDYCEREGITYTIGLVTNTRLEALAAPRLARAQQLQAETGGKIRLAGEAEYQAASWAQARRVVFKAEALPQGPNTRFVVTTRTDAPLALYDWYVRRGEPEQWVGDLKDACFADRLSDHRFLANQFRLLLHVAVYCLLATLRDWLVARAVPRCSLLSLRLRLLKLPTVVRETASAFTLSLPTGHPTQALWRLLFAPGHR
jgi:hypothetical protein